MYGQSDYSKTLYADFDPTESQILAHAPDLMKYLPTYYHKSKVTQSVLNSHSYELGKIDVEIEDIHAQLNIDTATWGLVYYERVHGIATNLDDTYENRREVIKARMRGQGTVTKAMIKLTAEAFSGGEVDVIEHNNESYFVIRFIGVLGIPRNMGAFLETIEDLCPAHLGYEIEYTYTVWDMIHDKNATWNDTNNQTWSQLRTFK